MKISKLFHWLYASLMFLPLLVAPIFAIYSHRHEINDYSIQVQETKVVDFNQLVQNGNFNNFTGWDANTGVVYSINDNVCTFTSANDDYSGIFMYLSLIPNHKYVARCQLQQNDSSGTAYLYGGGNRSNNSNNSYWNSVSFISDTSFSYIAVRDSKSSDWQPINVKNVNVFDLTQMFGVGNEPSLQQFNIWFPDDYYSYTLSRSVLLKTGNYITYDDTDIGSQFLYDLYNTTDKYLNFDSVLNLYQVNDWINLNVFNGSVPLVWYIIWHYLDYWLLLSIFWLCFDVLIYVPQLAHRWLDKASLE